MSRVATLNRPNPLATVRALVQGQTNALAVTTSSRAGTLMEIPHDLGRVPIGYTIGRGPFAVFQHGWNSDDTAWTDKFIYLRFGIASTDLTILVF